MLPSTKNSYLFHHVIPTPSTGPKTNCQWDRLWKMPCSLCGRQHNRSYRNHLPRESMYHYRGGTEVIKARGMFPCDNAYCIGLHIIAFRIVVFIAICALFADSVHRMIATQKTCISGQGFDMKGLFLWTFMC